MVTLNIIEITYQKYFILHYYYSENCLTKSPNALQNKVTRYFRYFAITNTDRYIIHIYILLL